MLKRIDLHIHTNISDGYLTPKAISAGESAKLGAIREAKEEIGIDVSEAEMQFMF